MFHLHLSNRTENLLAQLALVLGAQPRSDLFAKEYFLIQSQGMERMLSQRLADVFGVWCNFEYLLPTRFFDLMAARVGLIINPDAYHREALTWRLDALLYQVQQAPEPLFAPILHYINGEQGALKRFQLAQQLANLFDQYQIMRPEMLDSWQEQKINTKNSAEPWQMELWRRLRASLDNSPHRGELLRHFLRIAHTRDDLKSALPSRLSIFGLHSMPPLLLDCLHGISRHCAVHFFLLSPCQNYWADLPGKRQLLQEDLLRIKNGHEPLALSPDIHPLLGSLGKQGRDFQSMLFERIDSEHLQETESFEEPTALNPAAPCLLHRLQSDLLDGDWQEKTAEESSVLDSSLSFVSCYSAVQELMVLKDQILYWLQDNPDMELCDIVVMAPDIQEYAPIIPAIFHDIQHSIADRSARQHDSGLEIFFQFLDLAVSRCSWSAVLDLLEKPEIALAFGDLSESDLELIRHWVLGSGIRWGLSGDGLHSEGIPELADISWQAGLDRLLLGYAMDCQEPVPSKGILPQGHFPPRALSPKGTFPQEHFLQGTCGAHGILPYPDIEGSQAEPLGGLCQFLELLERASRDFTHPRPLAAWSSLLLSHARSLFGSDQEKTLGQLREILTTLGEYGADNNSSPKGTLPQEHITPRALYPKGTLPQGHFLRGAFGAPSGRLQDASGSPASTPVADTTHRHAVPLETVRAWLESSASESKSSSGFLRGQLSFCSMLPMRSIPFRAVCLLGLNDGVFPKTDRHPPFDLLRERVRPGDRSQRDDDRYQFLEAVLSARQYLYLSFVGQSIRSGKTISPSVLITELIETLSFSYGLADPIRKHPLHPFSPDYFRGTTLFSFNAHNCEVARALIHPLPPPESSPKGILPQGDFTPRALYPKGTLPQGHFLRGAFGAPPKGTSFGAPEPWWTGSLPEDHRHRNDDGTDRRQVTIADLLSFFAGPQKWFVRNRLNINLEAESAVTEDNELFAVTGLEAYQVNQNLLQSFLEERDDGRETGAARMMTQLKAQGRWMLGTPGQLAFDQKIPELQDFAARIAALNSGSPLPDLPVDLSVFVQGNTIRLTGLLGCWHENSILLARYSECKGKDLLKAWIHHLLATAVCLDHPVTTHLLCKDRLFRFPPCPEPFPHLAQLLTIFEQGCLAPSPLLVEPAWAFVQQAHNPQARKSPLKCAIDALTEILEKGYETELALLYGECDPASLLGLPFHEMCGEFFAPIFAKGKTAS